MTCNRCKGDGFIAGHWMPETCPVCGGRGEFRPVEDADGNGAGFLVAAIGLALILLGVAMWPAIEFLGSVL